MTPKQQRFVEEYLIDFNASQAAARAGYSAKTAGAIGSRLLKKVKVAAAVAEGRAKHSNALIASREEVLRELTKVARFNVETLTGADKVRALERLGRYHKLWEEGGQGGTTVAVQIVVANGDLGL